MTDAWEGILGSDEKILWQGAPNGGVRFDTISFSDLTGALFGVGFAVFWMAMASKAGGIFWMFGLLFLARLIHGLVTIHFWHAYVRKHQHYTLTNERAMIGTDMFGRKKLTSYPIDMHSELVIEQDGYVGDVYFATQERKTKDRARTTRIGFIQIESPQHVLSLLQKVKDEKSS